MDDEWQDLYYGPDTIDTQTQVVAYLERVDAKRPEAQEYLAAIRAGTAGYLMPMQRAVQRVLRLKSYHAPQNLVKRAVKAVQALEPKGERWEALFQGPDTLATQNEVVAWLDRVAPSSSDYYQAKHYQQQLLSGKVCPMSEDEQAAQTVRRLKAHGAPEDWIAKAVAAFLKIKFHT